MSVLKRLSSPEAECVIEHLTSWAQLQLEDKAHISDEVMIQSHAFPAVPPLKWSVVSEKSFREFLQCYISAATFYINIKD